MGGGIAGALAARRPDLVSAAVLEEPAWRDPEHRVQPRGIVHERIAECRAFADDPQGQLDKGRADNPTWPEVEFAPWVESKAQVDLDFLDLGIANLLQPWDDIVEAISVPTLVLLAQRGGPVTPEVRARAAQLDNPHVDIRVVDGAGHCIRRDRPTPTTRWSIPGSPTRSDRTGLSHQAVTSEETTRSVARIEPLDLAGVGRDGRDPEPSVDTQAAEHVQDDAGAAVRVELEAGTRPPRR